MTPVAWSTSLVQGSILHERLGECDNSAYTGSTASV